MLVARSAVGAALSSRERVVLGVMAVVPLRIYQAAAAGLEDTLARGATAAMAQITQTQPQVRAAAVVVVAGISAVKQIAVVAVVAEYIRLVRERTVLPEQILPGMAWAGAAALVAYLVALG